MIWFFLAGFISGAVGMVLFAGWWIRKHAKRIEVDHDDLVRLIHEERHTEEGDMPSDCEGRGISEPDRRDV